MTKMLTRDAVLMGPPGEVRGWAVGVAGAFETATGRRVGVWSSIVGGVTGHVSWSMPVGGAAEMVQLTATAFDDDAYLASIEEGRHLMAGPAKDTLYRPYGGAEFDPDQGEAGNVAIVTTATARAGSLGEAVGWGLEAAEYVGQLTGIPTVLLGNAAGRFSRLTWMGVAEDAAAADAAQDAWATDDGYRKLIARGGDHFVDGSARTQLFARLA